MYRASSVRLIPVAGKLLPILFACGVLLMGSPAQAQIDLTGSWASRMHEDWMERCCGRDLVDYTGLPLSDEARALALRYSPTAYAMRERQCLLHSPYSFQFWPHGLRIWNETDAAGRVIAWKFGSVLERDGLTVWMDGRPHPSSNEFYPFSGFTTGRWEGDTLTTYTTHLKQTFTRRGNGSPASDLATVTAHITRHEDLLTITTIQEDPVYLTEPLVVSRTWQLDPRGDVARTSICYAVTEIPRLEDSGIVPHYFPGENPEVDFMVNQYGIPREAVLGYAETTYPEYRRKLADTYEAPAACERYCCGWSAIQSGSTFPAPGLICVAAGTRSLPGRPADSDTRVADPRVR
jgi:hypothetical protein